jgi:hypothetical protein
MSAVMLYEKLHRRMPNDRFVKVLMYFDAIKEADAGLA